MLTYKLDDNGNPVQVDDLQEWAVWYCNNQPKLIIDETDIRDRRNKFVFKVTTRFRGQIGPLTDPARPLVWVTEGTNGDFFGAVPTKAEAKNLHQRTVRMLNNKYGKK
jgi:hypothetical protein